MKEINIAEILKDCPKGMELDCVMYDNVSFDKVSDDEKSVYPIFCYITDEKGNRSGISFTENGYESKRYGAKCVIFPKGKTTWEGFQRPFKDGDVVVCEDGRATQMFILKFYKNNNRGYCYTGYDFNRNVFFDKGYWGFQRLATEEEKQKLFDAIKANGYKWNAETKTLEKLIEPKFKVGDRIKHRLTGDVYRVLFVQSNGYSGEVYYHVGITDKIGKSIDIEEQDSYELVPEKFDITTLKPFESKVLVRNIGAWEPAFWGYYSEEYSYPFVVVGGNLYCQCIPYESNKHLLGTTDDCDEYYKTWE